MCPDLPTPSYSRTWKRSSWPRARTFDSPRGGYVGLELAQAFTRFGSRVTVIERGPRLLGREDQDVSDALLELFRDESIEVLLQANLLSVSGTSGQSVRVKIEQNGESREIGANDILVATGRTPNTQGIGLDKAGVELDGRDYVKVNERRKRRLPQCGRWMNARLRPIFVSPSLIRQDTTELTPTLRLASVSRANLAASSLRRPNAKCRNRDAAAQAIAGYPAKRWSIEIPIQLLIRPHA